MGTDPPQDNAQHTTTVHKNLNWSDLLKRQFKELIVDKCSESTRNVFDCNDDIKVCLNAIEIILISLFARVYDQDELREIS